MQAKTIMSYYIIGLRVRGSQANTNDKFIRFTHVIGLYFQAS